VEHRLFSTQSEHPEEPAGGVASPQQQQPLESPRHVQEQQKRGLTFPEMEQFFLLLNNLADFAFAYRLYSHAGHSLSKKEFARAAKISLNGQELSEGVIDVIFALFDEAGEFHCRKR
jgi:hypothetical protein